MESAVCELLSTAQAILSRATALTRDATVGACIAAAAVPLASAIAAAKAAAAGGRRPTQTPSLDDAAPLIAQAGHRAAADILAQLNRYLRSEERTWRAISRECLGLFGRTRLSAAARAGNLARCTFLIEHGADVNAHDTHGRTPLLEARARGHGACAALLLAHGAEESAPFGGVLSVSWAPPPAAVVLPPPAADRVYALAAVAPGPGAPARIASSHFSGAIHVRDAATGAVTATLLGHTAAVRALVALPGGRLASASFDTVCVCGASPWACARPFLQAPWAAMATR